MCKAHSPGPASPSPLLVNPITTPAFIRRKIPVLDDAVAQNDAGLLPNKVEPEPSLVGCGFGHGGTVNGDAGNGGVHVPREGQPEPVPCGQWLNPMGDPEDCKKQYGSHALLVRVRMWVKEISYVVVCCLLFFDLIFVVSVFKGKKKVYFWLGLFFIY